MEKGKGGIDFFYFRLRSAKAAAAATIMTTTAPIAINVVGVGALVGGVTGLGVGAVVCVGIDVGVLLVSEVAFGVVVGAAEVAWPMIRWVVADELPYEPDPSKVAITV